MAEIVGVKRAIEILRWCITNKMPLQVGCKQFEVSNSYIRNTRKKYGHLNDLFVNELKTLYNNFKSIKTRINVQVNLDNEIKFVEKEQTKFYQEPYNGVIDAQGYNHVKTLDQIIAEAQIDLKVWEVERHLINKWDVTNAGGETYQNWQVKVWLKRIKTEQEEKQFEEFLSHIAKYAPSYKLFVRSKKEKKYAFEISIPDVHIGKMAWSPETGQDYDTKLAINEYDAAVNDLVMHLEPFKDEVEEILFPIGNDLINIDNFRNETTNGTPQHVDSRWQKMFLKAKEMLIRNIDRLRPIAPIKIIMVSGNHDRQTIFYLGEALKAWYRNVNDVDIDNGPAQRKYYSYGLNLTLFTHGDEEKHHDLGLIMANEVPELWATSKYRQAHLGHLHKKKETKWVDSDEFPGFKVKILPSISARDAWHASKGYGSARAAMGILYHKTRGPIAEFTYNVGV